jgi:hypothetical protein
MKSQLPMAWVRALSIVLAALAIGSPGIGAQRSTKAVDDQKKKSEVPAKKLTHEETLRWIAENKAWRLARKTRPIWARPVEAEEIGKEFETADHVKEKARAGVWLCAGVAGEPWFQALEKIEAKYERRGQETKAFEFDTKPRPYRKFQPKPAGRSWVAQVKVPGIAGFFIRPGYDPERPLYSPSGGYVVKDDVENPYRDKPKDVWLVQQSLFESTYELVREREPKTPPAKRR